MLLRKRTRIAAGLHMGRFMAWTMNTALLEDTYLAFTTSGPEGTARNGG